MSLAQLTIRLAVASEKQLLEALQWRSSLNNPGDRASLIANPDAVEIPRGQIEGGGVFVAEVTNGLLGWAAILPRDDGDEELDALFVEPEVWGRGVGSALIERCSAEARAKGALSIHVVGNPHAEGFYRKCGFELLGERQTRFGKGLVMKKSIL
jgi:GNAT superfamily N-acetyltransferase